MTVRIIAKDYIQRTQDIQRATPPANKKIVPNVEEIAEFAGVRRQAIYAFLNREQHKRLDIDIVDGIIKAFRAYGHDTSLTDILQYED